MSSSFSTRDGMPGKVHPARPPREVSVVAPGRVNLIGEHVDYQGGLVVPAAIDRYISASASAIDAPEIRLSSANRQGRITVPLGHQTPFSGADHWANYAFGVVAKYRDAGHVSRGFEVVFDSNLPLGAGLSSSAAMESATALVVEGLLGIDLDPVERALRCQAAEHDWAGVPCGIMDQLAVNAGVPGNALKIDCRSLAITPTPIPDGLALVVVDSRVKHALADGEYAKRKADCETAAEKLGVDELREATAECVVAAREHLGERIFKRARHVVSEIARVPKFTAALAAGESATAGALMAASHASLRDDFEVSCKELDALVALAGELGAIGSRMMGGGFGGSTINLVPVQSAGRFSQEIAESYRERFGTKVEAFVVQAVGRAAIVGRGGDTA